MLSVVVHKRGDMQPGPGFFLQARYLGHDTKGLLKFRPDQLRQVHAVWSLATFKISN
jgi:hypothetical protein